MALKKLLCSNNRKQIKKFHFLFKVFRLSRGKYLKLVIAYQSMLNDVEGSNVEGGSVGIIPGGAGIGIGFMISSMLNLGITLRS